ncbi:DUF6221 family protein [Streptomyces sp. CA-181903]|uniref:DUF6221 family protein n=1 Tax=Streptomyces sp. CA-181903 TaxID=3240055 RepID=UPI003D8C207C
MAAAAVVTSWEGSATMTADLVVFLRDRPDEDERAARTVLGARWVRRTNMAGAHADDARGDRPYGTPIADCRRVSAGYERRAAIAEHIVRHQPARVLVEVEAKRRSRMLTRQCRRNSGRCGPGCAPRSPRTRRRRRAGAPPGERADRAVHAPCAVARTLALRRLHRPRPRRCSSRPSRRVHLR